MFLSFTQFESNFNKRCSDMKDKLKTTQTLQLGDEKISALSSRKASYSSPVLQVYGSVSKLTQTGGATTSDGIGTFAMSMSDPRAKENIVKVGVHSLGIGLYLFDYLPEYRDQWGHGRQFGVMADEVETVVPEAVAVFADGYKRVNYAILGVRHPVH
jgi:hypothetical protein